MLGYYFGQVWFHCVTLCGFQKILAAIIENIWGQVTIIFSTACPRLLTEMRCIRKNAEFYGLFNGNHHYAVVQIV